RKIYLAHDGSASRIEGREAHAVAVERQGFVDTKAQIPFFVEKDRVASVEGKHLLLADALHLGLDLVRIDTVGRLAGKAEQNRAVGAVSAAGQGERSVKIDDDAGGLFQLAARGQLVREAAGRAHRPDSVRA